MAKKIIFNLLIIFISLLFALATCEIILRVKHTITYDYDIEQWKYAKKLKIKNSNIKIGHTHRLNSKSKLQGVEIKINSYGQRDIEYDNSYLEKFDKSILFIGSSITLGWGVDNNETFISRLNQLSKKNNKNWVFINGGIGNYNTERYINNYFKYWSDLRFTDIVVHFFVNDTEVINSDNSNFFTRNFQTGVILWKYLNSLRSDLNVENLEQYYLSKYSENYEGYKVAINELKIFSSYCEEKSINCHFILMPDIHQLNPYNLNFINKKMKVVSENLNFKYFDLLKTLENIKPVKSLWNKYNDPHPNEFAHKLMGESLFSYFDK